MRLAAIERLLVEPCTDVGAERERRLERARCVVRRRAREAEHDHRAIAHEAEDEAAPLGDLPLDEGVELLQYLARPLGTEALAQAR